MNKLSCAYCKYFEECKENVYIKNKECSKFELNKIYQKIEQDKKG